MFIVLNPTGVSHTSLVGRCCMFSLGLGLEWRRIILLVCKAGEAVCIVYKSSIIVWLCPRPLWQVPERYSIRSITCHASFESSNLLGMYVLRWSHVPLCCYSGKETVVLFVIVVEGGYLSDWICMCSWILFHNNLTASELKVLIGIYIYEITSWYVFCT